MKRFQLRTFFKITIMFYLNCKLLINDNILQTIIINYITNNDINTVYTDGTLQ